MHVVKTHMTVSACYVCVSSGVPVSAVVGVPVFRRAHRPVCLPRAALHGLRRPQRARPVGHLLHRQVGPKLLPLDTGLPATPSLTPYRQG